MLFEINWGLGTLWIANTCFAYNDMVEASLLRGQLIGAVQQWDMQQKNISKAKEKSGRNIRIYVRKW